jgi:hypothetical protein
MYYTLKTMTCKRLVIFLIILLFPYFAIYSENGEFQQVRVAGIKYLIANQGSRRVGITRESALRKYYRLNVGDVFDSTEDLEKKLESVTQSLNTEKVFKEISYEVSYWKEDTPLMASENLGAHITIYVEDSASLYLYPTAAYDSNLGTVYGGNLTYNNVLGTLSNLTLKGYGGTDSWEAGGTWENIALGFVRGDASVFCEEVTTKRVDDDDSTVLEYTNLLLDAYFQVDFPVSYNWVLSFRPGVYYYFNYDLVSYDDDYGRDEYDDLSTSTSGFLEYGATYTDYFWEENFRKGIEGELLLTYEGTLSEWDPTISVDGGFSLFYRPVSFLGMAHHVSAFYVVDDIREEAGQYIRGVYDYIMYGEWGIFLNNNIEMRAFTIPPVLEMHGYPLLDMGLVYNEDTTYDSYDFRLTAGFGITLFPLFLQSFQLNIEVGYDLLNDAEAEVSIKSELFF